MSSRRWQGSARRVFVVYAAITLLPVLVLASALLWLTARQTDQLSIRLARQEVTNVASAEASLLAGHDLSSGLTPGEKVKVSESTSYAIRSGEFLRLRLRDLAGQVVFSDDGSGFHDPVDEDVAPAAAGHVVVHITHLNDDANDTGPLGPAAIEGYVPLRSVTSDQRIGVLEIYLPFAPIEQDEASDRGHVMLAIGIGLLLLWSFLLLVSRSVTARLNRQTALAVRNARQDQLTGLANRSTFARLMERAGPELSVAYLDIQNIEEVNETLGYEVGDELIAAVAGRLADVLPADSSPARIGGDKFAFRFTGGSARLDSIRTACMAPLRLAGLPFAVDVRMGWASRREDEQIAELLSRADMAMAEARRTRVAIVEWNAAADRRDPDALRLLGELSAAIKGEQFELHFQPKVAAADGRLVGVEALVRWRHPSRGLLFPDAFLEAAERTELIDELTDWVIPSACEALKALPAETSMAINISAGSLIREEFAGAVLGAITSTGIATRRVVLEITETALIADPPRAAETLARLAAAGIRLSIDDFGAGQTSLAYLAGLPVAELKVDRSFVMRMAGNARNTAIVASVIELGHALGLTVVAEGVEDAAARDTLREMGCDLMQGYFFARPQPLSALLSLLADEHFFDMPEQRGNVGFGERGRLSVP